MTMRKYLLIFLSLVFVASISQAKVINSIYQIPKTKIAPKIDGVQDAVWMTVDWNMQQIYNVGDPPTATSGADSGAGLTGMSKAMWDNTNIYILVYSVDDIITEIPANANWNQDAIELYFDGDNSKIKDGVSPDPGGGLAPGDWQFTIPHWYKGTESQKHLLAFGSLDSTGVEFAIQDVSDTQGYPGWMLEVKIPLANLGIDGVANTKIGWEVQQDESDLASAGRQSMSKWWSNSNNSWTDASLWGTAVLSGREVDSTLVINKTNQQIAIDGVMDAAYANAYQATTNLSRVGDPPGADAADTDPMFGGFVTVYPLYDATNFYAFFDVNDAILTNVRANAGWNQDAVEIYFDGDNSKIKDGVSPDPGGGLAPGDFQYTIQNDYKNLQASKKDSLKTAIFGATAGPNADFFIKDKAQGGYTVELKIALADISIDPAIGQKIGFEFQLDNSNDATAGRQGMLKWWHNSNNSWTDASLWGTASLGPLVTSGVSKNNPTVVTDYQLQQNYPNPFNPSTQITYSVPKNERVKLSVYNLLGSEVAVLVNRTMAAGSYTVPFSAQNLTSGVYFYKLEAGNTLLVKKMMFLK
jgi:hypothetical protein